MGVYGSLGQGVDRCVCVGVVSNDGINFQLDDENDIGSSDVLYDVVNYENLWDNLQVNQLNTMIELT